jgi:glycerophosphoryl diester phosphodiesterase
MKIFLTCFVYILLIGLTLQLGIQLLEKEPERSEIKDFRMLRDEVRAGNPKTVLVVAHRGDWRNAPENSLQAIKNCIALGVDMVEIDIQKTKDNQLILMHDETLDRTTTGSGRVKDWTLDSLKRLRLRNGLGRPTHHTIPTLEEAMIVARSRILVNLDKCYDYFGEAYGVLKRTGTIHQVVIKGRVEVERVRNDFGQYLDDMYFMPVVDLDARNAYQIVKDYQEDISPVAFEFIFRRDTSALINDFGAIKRHGTMIWVNSLWATLNAGWEDDMAVHNADSIYGWYVDKGVTMIQTDRPQLLLDYLRKRGLHD